MKIRSIRVHGDPVLGDISMELSTKNGVRDVVLVSGDNGSGKSLLMSIISEAFMWGMHPPGHLKEFKLPFSAKLISVEFEVEEEVHAVNIRQGRVEPNLRLSKVVGEISGSMDSGKHIVLSYMPSRSSWAASLGGVWEAQEGGLSAALPIINDLMKKDFRECVIVVDDIDLGLSTKNTLALFKYVQEQSLSRGCQLICSSRSPVLVQNLPKTSIVQLEGGFDIVEAVSQATSTSLPSK